MELTNRFIHRVGTAMLGALLLSGCNRESATTPPEPASPTSPPAALSDLSPVEENEDALAPLIRRLASTDADQRAQALTALGAAGAEAKRHLAQVESCISDAAWPVRFAAIRAYVEIAGPEKAANTFLKIVTDPSNPTAQNAALIGLEKCSRHTLPAVSVGLGEAALKYQAVSTAAHVDVEGKFLDRIQPLLQGQSQNITLAARKYLLAVALRRFHASHQRWPRDFAETQQFISTNLPGVDLRPLAERKTITLEVQPGGSVLVAGGYYQLAIPD
ncbi:MAG: HEAT repeat domain-containing protein [Verrucomicrobia bacterium]|nr:HEAT repeat domain-containing protein [Verrucomicrobiota bacterium]